MQRKCIDVCSVHLAANPASMQYTSTATPVAAHWDSKFILVCSCESRSSLLEQVQDGTEKRTKDTYGPPMGKKLMVFLDDLNMPRMDQYGTQQPIALLKLLIDRKVSHHVNAQASEHKKAVQSPLHWHKLHMLHAVVERFQSTWDVNSRVVCLVCVLTTLRLSMPQYAKEAGLPDMWSLMPVTQRQDHCGRDIMTEARS